MSDAPSKPVPGHGRDCLFEDKKGNSNAQPVAEKTAPCPQALVQYGYKHCTRRTYFIRLQKAPSGCDEFVKNGLISLSNTSPAELLAALNKVYRHVEKRQHKHRSPAQSDRFLALDIAWTFSGLEALGLDPRLLRVFRRKSRAFAEGAWLRAAQHVGDTGPSDVRHWHQAYQARQNHSVDLILVAHFAADASNSEDVISPNFECVTAFENALIRRLCKKQAPEPPLSSPMQSAWIEVSEPLDWEGAIHFGYKDGITKPQYSAAGAQAPYTADERHAWGELLLGHQRNQNDNPYGHLDLPPAALSPEGLDWQGLSRKVEKELNFFKNSSFGVFRKMQQKEAVFEAWVKEQASKLCSDEKDLYAWEVWVKAKIMGRMPIVERKADSDALPLPPGTRLTAEMLPQHLLDCRTLKQVPDPNLLGKEGGFLTPSAPLPNDESGKGCPYASHIRRMNPKDDPVVPFISRPLLRRGMSYKESTVEGQTEVGLSGLFLCADIEAQFEHLVGRWANHRVMGVVDGSNCRDPIIGNHQNDGLRFIFEQHSRALDQKLGELSEPFVVTRGCVYAWFPSKNTLEDMHHFLPQTKNQMPQMGRQP